MYEFSKFVKNNWVEYLVIFVIFMIFGLVIYMIYNEDKVVDNQIVSVKICTVDYKRVLHQGVVDYRPFKEC